MIRCASAGVLEVPAPDYELGVRSSNLFGRVKFRPLHNKGWAPNFGPARILGRARASRPKLATALYANKRDVRRGQRADSLTNETQDDKSEAKSKKPTSQFVLLQPALPSVFPILSRILNMAAPLYLFGALQSNRPPPFPSNQEEADNI